MSCPVAAALWGLCSSAAAPAPLGMLPGGGGAGPSFRTLGLSEFR